MRSPFDILGGFANALGVGGSSGPVVPAPPAANRVAWTGVGRARSAGRLWQNTAKTTAATVTTDPVRVMIDEAGNEWTAPSDAERPLLTSVGAKWTLRFDGVNDRLASTLTKAQMPVAAADPETWGVATTLMENSPGAGFILYLGNGAAYAPSYSQNTLESQNGNMGYANYDQTSAGLVLTGSVFNTASRIIATRSSSNNRIYLNNTLAAGPAASGNPTTINAAAVLTLGAAQGTSLYCFYGDLYGFSIYSAALDATDRGLFDTWLLSLL
jgi:hypothetical protein